MHFYSLPRNLRVWLFLFGSLHLFVFLSEKLEVSRPFWQLFLKILAVLTPKLLGGREQIKPQAMSSNQGIPSNLCFSFPHCPTLPDS